jgi:N-acetylgalactosamine-6-sulfatase
VLSHADDRIGEVLATLDRMRINENTLVIFSSDNGPARGSEKAKLDLQYDTATGAGWGIAASKGVTAGRKGYKAALFEGGINVPFIARWPGKIPAGKRDNTSLISAVDLLPTFCELAGATPPKGYQPDGISQVEVLKGKASATRTKPLFWKMGGGKDSEFHWANYAVVDQQWKLLTTADATRVELYDIAADALETKNLALDKAEIVAAITATLAQWKTTLAEKPSGAVFSAERTK